MCKNKMKNQLYSYLPNYFPCWGLPSSDRARRNSGKPSCGALPMVSFFYCLLTLSPSIALRHLRAGDSYPVVKGSLITNLKAIVTEVILLEISLLSSSGLSSFCVILKFWSELIFKCYFRNGRIRAREL